MIISVYKVANISYKLNYSVHGTEKHEYFQDKTLQNLIFETRLKSFSQIAAAHPAVELRGMLRAAAMSIEF
jgi:hypothetical protein